MSRVPSETNSKVQGRSVRLLNQMCAVGKFIEVSYDLQF